MRRTLAVLGGLALAVGFSQFPEYAQQYEQRLGGAVDELATITADFDTDAQKFGLTREQALQRYATSPDSFLVGRGTSMQRTLTRYGALSADLADLRGAGPLQRLVHLNDYFDSDVGARALADYKPAVPVTAEGFTWALAGFGAGYLLVGALLAFLSLPFRWRNGHLPHRRAQLWKRREAVLVEAVVVEEKATPVLPRPRPPAEQRYG
ncbi:MAG TPA: DUF2937 family protein [Devosia sp.]|jgi:hypothetical protein|nr:DUF2937 family protein [Devosia sp.]